MDQIENVILGGGGHSKVILDTLMAIGGIETFVIVDADPQLWGKTVSGVPIVGGDEVLSALVRKGAKNFIVGLGGVGDNQPRRRLFELGLQHGLMPITLSHPSAICSPSASIGDGSLLCPKAVVNANSVVNSNVIINTGAIIEHECRIGDHVHVSSGAVLASTVIVGPQAHVGAGATVLQGVEIGEGAVIGAGAVTIRDVEPWTIVVGVPAVILRRIK